MKRNNLLIAASAFILVLIVLSGCSEPSESQPSYSVVMFDQQGGSGGAASIAAIFGESMQEAAVPVMAGYTFGGYYTEEGGAGTKYYTETMTGTQDWDKTINTTLYAKWTANEQTLSFDANDGEGTMNPLILKTDERITLPANSFTREGYSFDGWLKSSDGSVMYADEDAYTMDPTDSVLYAKWTADEQTLSFDANDGSGTMSSQTVKTDEEITLPANSFTREGYSFDGWLKSSNGSVMYADEGVYTMGPTDSVLYAKWIDYPYTYEGPGFANPEDAARAYLTFLKDQDLSGMLSTFAIESYVEHFNFESFIQRVRSYMLSFPIKLPNTNEYNKELNIGMRRSQISDQIVSQYMYHQTPDQVNDMSPTTFSDNLQDIADFVETFERDTANYLFKDLVIVGILEPDSLSGVFGDERNQQNIARVAEYLGVEKKDIANVAITFDADGRRWLFCPQTVRYNNRWYMESLMGNLALLEGLDSFSGGIMIHDNLN
jgi:uncharacterized repeat protein (TIGR02543 family)